MQSIVTNIQLRGFEVVDGDECAFCLNKPEIFLHLFSVCSWCSVVDKFWKDLSDRLYAKLRIRHHIT